MLFQLLLGVEEATARLEAPPWAVDDWVVTALDRSMAVWAIMNVESRANIGACIERRVASRVRDSESEQPRGCVPISHPK